MHWKLFQLYYVLLAFYTFGKSTILTPNMSSVISNPGVLRLVEKYREVCPFTELCRVETIDPDVNATFNLQSLPCCEPCRCTEDTPCQDENACCPDDIPRLLNFGQIRAILDDPVRCAYMQFMPHGQAMYDGSTFKVISRCPRSFYDDETKRKCERDYIEFDFSENPSGFMPVTDMDESTGRMFKNKYCAECHGLLEQDTVHWTVKMCCLPENAVILNNLGDIVPQIGSKKCNVIFEPPQLATSFLSHACVYEIDRCNVTGQWKRYDQGLEAACLSYTSEYQHHKNIHCYMCNGHGLAEIKEQATMCQFSGYNSYSDSFTATLDMGSIIKAYEQKRPAQSICSQGTRYDTYTKSCRRLYCPPMMFLTHGRCLPFYSKLEQPICYHVRFKLTPFEVTTVNITALTSLGDAIQQSLKKPASKLVIEEFEFILKLDVKIKDISAETVNAIQLLYIYVGRRFYVPSMNTTSTLDNMAELYNIDLGMDDQFIKEFVAEEDDLFNLNAPIYEQAFMPVPNVNEAFGKLVYASTDPTDGRAIVNTHFGGMMFGCTAQIFVTPSHFCPKVVLEGAQFQRRVDDEGHVNVTVLGQRVNVTDVIFFDGYNKSLISEHLYFDILGRIKHVTQSAGCLGVDMIMFFWVFLLLSLF